MPDNTLTLSVFIDALGWELLSGRGFLDDVLTTRRPLQTVFGYSCTCCPTILSGKMPREHGHLSFYFYDPQNSPFAFCKWLKILPSSLMNRGRVRRVLSRAVARARGYDGYFQLYNVPFEYLQFFDYLEKKDIYQPDGLRNGTPTIFDRLRSRRIPFHLSNWRHSEEQNLAALEKAIDEGEIRFAYLYMAALDAMLHARGTRDAAIADKIGWYEKALRRIIERARRRYDVHLFLFSDHGMTDIVDTCDLVSRIEGLGLRFGHDYAAMYDSTMARFWFLRPAARDAILEVLRAEPRGRILTQDELAAYEVDFPNAQFGELFFLLEPGVLLCPSYMGAQPMAGMHGYAPEHPQAWATFASNVELPAPPRRLDDLHDVMLGDVEQPVIQPKESNRMSTPSAAFTGGPH